MSQSRNWNFGDTFTSTRVNSSQRWLHTSGVFSGYDITITDTDKLELSTGFILLPNGIMVGEDNPIELIISPLPAASTDYTITVRHTDSDVIGGQAALYAVETGEILPSAVTDGVVIGYIRYPGGAVALDISHVFQSRKVTEEPTDEPRLVPLVLLAPFSSKWVADFSAATNTTQTDQFTSPNVFTTVATDALGPAPPGFESSFSRLPLRVERFRPFSILVDAIIDANSLVVVSLLDTDGNSVTLSDATLSPTATFSTFTVSVDPASGVFTDSNLYTLSLEFRTPSSESVEIRSIILTYDPLP